MERIKALQNRLPREQRGSLNLMYMNALAELHNYGSKLGCDYRAMTPPERTAFVRQTGKTAVQNRHLYKTECGLGVTAELVGASVLPHMIALELIDWIEELLETILQETIPIRLIPDRDAEVLSDLLKDIQAFYPEILLELTMPSKQSGN